MLLLSPQLSDLQEEMSRRETRWTASSTRLRDRIDILEKENVELREEAKLLEKQRLEAWRRDDERVKVKKVFLLFFLEEYLKCDLIHCYLEFCL